MLSDHPLESRLHRDTVWQGDIVPDCFSLHGEAVAIALLPANSFGMLTSETEIYRGKYCAH